MGLWSLVNEKIRLVLNSIHCDAGNILQYLEACQIKSECFL